MAQCPFFSSVFMSDGGTFLHGGCRLGGCRLLPNSGIARAISCIKSILVLPGSWGGRAGGAKPSGSEETRKLGLFGFYSSHSYPSFLSLWYLSVEHSGQ